MITAPSQDTPDVTVSSSLSDKQKELVEALKASKAKVTIDKTTGKIDLEFTDEFEVGVPKGDGAKDGNTENALSLLRRLKDTSRATGFHPQPEIHETCIQRHL